MNKLKKLIPIVPLLIFPLWLIASRLLNNNLSELAQSYSTLAADGGVNLGQTI